MGASRGEPNGQPSSVERTPGMKKTLSVAIVIGLLFGAMMVPAEAKKKKKKAAATVTRIEEVVEVAYQGPNVGVATPAATGGTCLVDQSLPFHCLSAFA